MLSKRKTARKNKRAKKRRMIALLREAHADEEIQESTEVCEASSEASGVLLSPEQIQLCLGYEEEEKKVPRDKTIFPIEKEQTKEKPTHSGLRCKKCFVRLCKDDDFEEKNGKLLIAPQHASVVTNGRRVS